MAIVYVSNQCLPKWIPFMLNPFKGNHHMYKISSFIAILMLWPINQQAASLGPQGSAEVNNLPPLLPPQRDPPNIFGPSQHGCLKMPTKSVTDLRSSSKGRPWGSSDLWRSRDLAMREKPLNSECPVPIEKFFHLAGCLFTCFFGKTDVPTVDAHQNPAITTCYLWNLMKNGFHILHINWWYGFLPSAEC